MRASPRHWTSEDDTQLLDMRNRGVRWAAIMDLTGRTLAALQSRDRLLRKVGMIDDNDLEPFAAHPPKDVLLERLKRFHGNDTIERDMGKLWLATLG